MTTPFICVLLAFILVLLSKIPLGVAQHQAGGYDNKRPRTQQAKLKGWGARARAAHYNTIESIPPFGIAVVIAHLAGLDERRASVMAMAFLVCRVIYIVAYLTNLDYLRTAVWWFGWIAVLGLVGLPLAT